MVIFCIFLLEGSNSLYICSYIPKYNFCIANILVGIILMNLNLKQIISVVGIGFMASLVILLMIYTAFAQIITDFLIDNISDNVILLVIIIGLFIFTIIISVIVGFFITGNISRNSVLKASVLSLLCLVGVLFIISNGILFFYYSNIYDLVYGFEVLLIFPQVLIYFSIYILGTIFNLFIITIGLYYIFFIFFLEKFYKIKI